MDLLQEINETKQEWLNMQNVYNELQDPGLIDAVIYRMNAAERKYEYLLQLAKAEKLVNKEIMVR